MKAIKYTGWTKQIKASEMPDNTLEYMDARIFSDIIIPLRETTGIPMWPSALERAHQHGVSRRFRVLIKLELKK